MTTDEVTHLEAALAQGGPDAALAALAELYRQRKQYHELFEVRKMQLRRELGLPLVASDATEGLTSAQRNRLEEGLLEACREVGAGLLAEGNIREGWMYLRPVGDRAEAARLLARIAATEENYEDLIDVCLHEGVDIGRGYGLVLEHFGTCNAITTFDSLLARRPRHEQAPAARLLVRQVHQDLVASVRADIARQEGAPPRETKLADLVLDRDWLFQDNAYHLDTTHLAATVRIARAVDAPQELAAQFQYPGEEPFVDIYPSHALYFSALLGQQVEQALAYFGDKARQLDPQQHGYAAVEVYLDLLSRLGRFAEALHAGIAFGLGTIQGLGQAPPLVELARQSGQFAPLLDYCRQRGDLLGYAATAIAASQAAC
jgi:hypothetical protein